MFLSQITVPCIDPSQSASRTFHPGHRSFPG
jgi:hypothetical protein